MAKQGMKRPEYGYKEQKNSVPAVPEIQGKAKHGKEHARPIIAGTKAPSLKVYHSTPFSYNNIERPISKVYSTIDNDLARDNLENNIPAADLQDL